MWIYGLGKIFSQFVEDVCAEPDRPFLQVEDVLADPPAGVDLELASGIAQLGVGGDGGEHVPGHIDLGHNGDEPSGGVGHDLGQVGLGVVAAMRGVVAQPLGVMADGRLAPPRSHLGEQRVTVQLEPPTLVVGEVEVKGVQLVQAGQVDQPEHEALGEEMPGHVEVDPPPRETGPSSISTPSTSTGPRGGVDASAAGSAPAGAERNSSAGSNWRNVRVP